MTSGATADEIAIYYLPFTIYLPVEMRVEKINRQRVRASEVRAPARAPRWVMPTVKAALVSADVAVAVACLVAAYLMREGGGVLVRFTLAEGFVWHTPFEPYGALLLLVVPIRMLALVYYKLYSLRGEFSYVEDVARVFKATAVGSLLIVAAAFL